MPPTERAFLRQAETVRDALETFITVQKKGSPRAIQCCLVEVVNFAVRPFYYSSTQILWLNFYFRALSVTSLSSSTTLSSRRSLQLSSRPLKTSLAGTRASNFRTAGAKSLGSMHALTTIFIVQLQRKVCISFLLFLIILIRSSST